MKIHELLSSPESWCKGALHEEKVNRDGTQRSYCIIGAIRECYGTGDDARSVFQKVLGRVNNTALTSRPLFLAAWNDADERTYEEVIQIAKELDI